MRVCAGAGAGRALGCKRLRLGGNGLDGRLRGVGVEGGTARSGRGEMSVLGRSLGLSRRLLFARG